MDQMLDRVRIFVKSGQKLAKLLADYRHLAGTAESGQATDPSQRTRPGVSGVSPVVFIRLLDKIAEVAEALPGGVGIEQWLADERTRVAAVQEEFRFGFGTALAEVLGELGIRPRGQLPVIRLGFFSLRVDFDAGSAVLFWGPEVEKLTGRIALAPAAVAREVREQQGLLRKRAVEPARLADMLHRAYFRWCRVGEREPGSRAPLIELLAELVQLIQPEAFRADPVRKRFVEYPRVQFSHDLYRLRSSDARLPRLHVATFDSTTSKTRALWVPDNDQGEGTNYSFLSYEKS